MDPTKNQEQDQERKQVVLKRITGVLVFFLSLFGALALLGFLFKALKYPDWELYFQLGFIGTAASSVIAGTLQLGKAVSMDESTLQRLTDVARFFLGVFGALLVLGAFFQILKYPNAALFLQLGIFGLVAALPVNGLLKLIEVMTMDTPGDSENVSSGGGF